MCCIVQLVIITITSFAVIINIVMSIPSFVAAIVRFHWYHHYFCGDALFGQELGFTHVLDVQFLFTQKKSCLSFLLSSLFA